MTWSGRHGTQKYPQTTVIAIIGRLQSTPIYYCTSLHNEMSLKSHKITVSDALKHFENMSGKPERTPERYIVTKVFVETGSQIRNPKKTSSKP